MDLHAWITRQVEATEAEAHAVLIDPTPLLRRCEADRRILARHRAAPVPPGSEWAEEYPYCTAHAYPGPDGSTVYPIQLNDCPELLDLAHAHGITSDVPAALRGPRWKP